MKNNQSHKGIKAITNQIKNSFVVSSFIYTMNHKEKFEAIQSIYEIIEGFKTNVKVRGERIETDSLNWELTHIDGVIERIKKILES